MADSPGVLFSACVSTAASALATPLRAPPSCRAAAGSRFSPSPLMSACTCAAAPLGRRRPLSTPLPGDPPTPRLPTRIPPPREILPYPCPPPPPGADPYGDPPPPPPGEPCAPAMGVPALLRGGMLGMAGRTDEEKDARMCAAEGEGEEEGGGEVA